MTDAASSVGVPRWTLGDRLRKARECAGLSTAEIAEVLEVTDRTVRNYETGATPIKRPALRVWAMRTGVPYVWLTTGEEPSDNPGGPASTIWLTLLTSSMAA